MSEIGYINHSAPLVAYKTVDETKTTDVVLTIDSDLQIGLDTNSLYVVYLYIYQNSHPLADFWFALDYSGTYTDEYITTDFANKAASVVSLGALIDVDGSSTDKCATVLATFRTTSSGTLAFYWRQGASSANPTTLLKDSIMVVTKIA